MGERRRRDGASTPRSRRASRRVGGYTWRERATSVVHGLGFADADFDRPLDTFSGGQLTRASLARALAAEADLLLLDEPTNHLDIESLEWLEQTLLGLDAAIVLVAHDRWFLETVGTAVLELEAGRSRFFPGTWTRVAQGAGGARDRARQGDRASAGRDRPAWSASSSASAPRRPRPGRRSRGQKRWTRCEREIKRDPKDGKGARVRVQEAGALGPRDLRARGRPRCRWAPSRGCCSTTPSCGSSAASTCRSSAPNGTGKTTLIDALVGERPLDARQAAHRPQRQGRLPLAARRGARGRRRAHGARGRGQAHRA